MVGDDGQSAILPSARLRLDASNCLEPGSRVKDPVRQALEAFHNFDSLDNAASLIYHRLLDERLGIARFRDTAGILGLLCYGYTSCQINMT